MWRLILWEISLRIFPSVAILSYAAYSFSGVFVCTGEQVKTVMPRHRERQVVPAAVTVKWKEEGKVLLMHHGINTILLIQTRRR